MVSFQVVLVGKPRGGDSQQQKAFLLLGKKTPVVSTYARGKKEYRDMSTKVCGLLSGHLGAKKKSKSVIVHFQRHIIHAQHLQKHGGHPDATKKNFWRQARTLEGMHPLPLHVKDLSQENNYVAWSDLVGDLLTSQPNAFDRSLGARMGYVLPTGEITSDASHAFLHNYVRPLFNIYEGIVPGNEDAVAAAGRLRAAFCTDLVVQHPMLSGCCATPWHFIIHTDDNSISTVTGPPLGGARVSIASLRASMFPCICEPVIAFLHGIGVRGENFCA